LRTLPAPFLAPFTREPDARRAELYRSGKITAVDFYRRDRAIVTGLAQTGTLPDQTNRKPLFPVIINCCFFRYSFAPWLIVLLATRLSAFAVASGTINRLRLFRF
jgi:hypothetical protein